MLDPYRCQICGETYLGQEVPDRCPFCGASFRHLVPAAEYIDYGTIELSPQSYEDCKEAVNLELNNAAFYKCAAEKAQTQITQSIFKRLSKQEMEHAELICKMMGMEEPPLPEVSCSDDDGENMMDAHKRETRAIKFYQEVANRAPEPRAQEVFRAISEIESEHLKISSVYR
ncbi:MAG: rubrerythrin [Candidatus Syntrophonatronum acetioxidans]|uniref:Rubrerythrin n=1 Tax=Candidatus Syntrophonatronum acetioxidans TaxID=1795816 RepID=A0A424YGU1_9FIRM|nr:MAG: rubrerythrin [Candidatus Syntrophonatronum acetioxidans]